MKKPKILLVPDRPDWAYDFAATEIVKFLGHKYDFEKKYLTDIPTICASEYDVIFDFCTSLGHLVKYVKNHKKMIASIRSYCDIAKAPQNHSIEFLSANYAAVSVVCRGMLDNISLPTFHTPLGVDANLFRPMDHEHKFTIGFAGSHKRKIKRLDLIEEAARKTGVNLKVAHKYQFAHVEMPHFYKTIDCYVCMSDSEGGPNTGLEAAACGKAIISTDVGVMSQIIEDKGGILVPFNDTKALVKAIDKIKDNPTLCRQMGEHNRQKIIESWTWEQQVKNYEKLFDFILGSQR